MYNNKVFNNLKKIISDEEILEEINDTFRPYHEKSLTNFSASPGIIEGASSIPLRERIASLPSEEETLEAIVVLWGRPALLIQDDTFEEPVSDKWKQRLNPHRQKLQTAILATGRVEVEGHPHTDWLGTGWMVKPNIMITNRHVAAEFTKREGNSFTFKSNHSETKMRAYLDFKEEYQNNEEKEIKIQDILWISDDGEPDMAVLKIEGQHEFIELQEHVDDGALLTVIGYPAFDGRRNDINAMNRIFRNIYNVKRLQPGFRMYPDTQQTFTHDCSTLGGNSGSPVIDVLTGKAVGLHFAGRYRQANYAVEGKYIIDKLNELLN